MGNHLNFLHNDVSADYTKYMSLFRNIAFYYGYSDANTDTKMV